MGVAWYLNRELVISELAPVNAGPNADPEQQPTILDLYETPITVVNDAEGDLLGRVEAEPLDWPAAYESVFCSPGISSFDEDTVAFFGNGRGTIINRADYINCTLSILEIKTRTFANYSSYFLVDQSSRRHLIRFMKSVVPKPCYLDFANQVVARLDSFDAIHIRREDFSALTLGNIGYEGTSIAQNVATVIESDSVLVICTDGRIVSPEFFGPIERAFANHLYLDEYILGDAKLREMYLNLPRQSDVVMALITQLVAIQSGTFVGTLFSTFTGIVHRERGFRDGVDNRFLFVHNPFPEIVPYDACAFLECCEGPYSWNRIAYPVPYKNYPWFREWSESYMA